MKSYRLSLCLLLVHAVLLCPTLAAAAFVRQVSHHDVSSVRQTTSQLNMISDLLTGKKQSDEPTLPRDIKEAIRRCRDATQAALQNRCSRMIVDFPVGTNFGIESERKSKPADRLTLDGLRRSDRELARLYVDMFQPVGGNRIVVAFADSDQADAAKKVWKKDASAVCRVFAINTTKKERSRQKKKHKSKGFASKLASELADDDSSPGPFRLPENTEVAVFVAPGPKELAVIQRISESVGMGTLVIILNSRLSSEEEPRQSTFLENFETVFHLTAAPQKEAPSCFLMRTFPREWILARKPKVGQPRVILSQAERPSAEECLRAFDGLELNDIERNIENFAEKMTGWFLE